MAMQIPAVKDAQSQRPIPTAWRPALREIVRAFARGDYRAASGIDGVAGISADTAAQVFDYLRDYGATLVELPEQAWETSICLWMGDHWDVLVDLWTETEGRSDLVLQARVTDSGPGYLVDVCMVYVPQAHSAATRALARPIHSMPPP